MRNQGIAFFLFVVVIGAVLAGLTWANLQFAQQNPGGNDFLVHWVGTRALVLQGLNPYSDEVALQIQEIAYGRAAREGEHELRVAYPLYSVAIFLPFALIDDFTLARAVWMTTLEAALVLLTIVSIRLVRWKPGPLLLAALMLFSLTWYHAVRPLINGNVVILVALGLAAGFLALRSGADELAGILFALTTIKPQVVVVVLAFVVFWGFATGRTRLVWWMLGMVFLLSVSAALFIPDWIVHNLREVIRYPSYNPPGTPRAAFIEQWPNWGARVGLALTGLMAAILLLEWWSNRHSEGRGFLWAVCMTLVVSQWIGIQTDPGNFIVLFPALVLVFALLTERWRSGGRWFVLMCMLALGFGIWRLFLSTVSVGDQPIQSALLFFPLPAFLLVTLYWVRWWAIQPPTVWFDMMDQ